MRERHAALVAPGVIALRVGDGALGKSWIEVQWQRLLEDAGLTDTGSDKPLPLHELPMLKAPPPVQDSSR